MKVDSRGYVYLGKQFAGDEFSLVIEGDGFVVRLEKVVKVPAKDAWFFDPDWQDGEKLAQADIDAGKTEEVTDVEEFFSKRLKKKK